ncbi:hypothetical protein [Streptomyces sp. CC53]|uniref:hypothetical protein n=1 Tax=Streptomyces sp. CC53 TaxID=1906740 RepID=UPI00115F9DBB|nr:hypothetical protein [Streptomyces sp. CC53]
MGRRKQPRVVSPEVQAAREEQRRKNREANKAPSRTPEELAALEEQRRRNRLANKSPAYLAELAEKAKEEAEAEAPKPVDPEPPKAESAKPAFISANERAAFRKKGA